MSSPFQLLAQQEYIENPESGVKNPYSSPFHELAAKEGEQEGFWKSAARTIAQPIQGVLEATGPGIAAGLFQLGALGESDLDIDTWHKLRELAEQEGGQFDEEAYEQARQQMLGMIPTVSNIASKIEKETGAPLEPKEGYQKALRLGSTAAGFQPGTLGQKLTAGAVAPAVSQGLQQAGLPEVFADPLGLLTGVPVGAKGPKFDIAQAKKPSGLAERRFEGITKPTEVPQKKIQQINDKLEKDFRDISDKIIKDSPIGETAKNLAEDPAFKQESRELLNQAQEIADSMPGTIPSDFIKKEYAKEMARNIEGFKANEYDIEFAKFVKKSIDSIFTKETKPGQLVKQYRKNNGDLTEYYEPGASKALNRAKKDALLAENRAIAKVMEEVYPDSELVPVFKEGNARWSKIRDAEIIDEFVNNIFPKDKPIDFKELNEFFDDRNYQRIFKKSLGEDGYKAFEQLTKDMLTSETPYKMLRVAKEKGWGDFYKTASSYILHPKLGQAKLGLDLLRSGYKSILNGMLDKPKFAFTWKKAVDDLKKGDFKASQKGFEALDKEVKAVKPEVLPKEEMPTTPKKRETIEAKVEKIEEPKQLEAPKKQIEHKEQEKPANTIKHADENVIRAKKEGFKKEYEEPKIEEGREFRDRFMEQPKGNEVRELEARKSKPKESAKPEPKEKAKSPSKQDVQWYLNKEDKKPFAGSTQAVSHGIEALIEPGDTFRDVYKKIKHDPEAKAIAKHYIDNDYGDIPIELDQSGQIKPFEKIESKPKENAKKSSASIPEYKNKLNSRSEYTDELFRIKLEREEVKWKSEPENAKLRKKFYQDKKKQLELLDEKSKLLAEEMNTKFPRGEILPESKIKEVKRQDISKKGLKEQKQWLIEQLDKAIEKAPEGPKDFMQKELRNNGKEIIKKRSEPYELLTFDVPGDGIMRIRNHKKALEQFRNSVEKKWPEKPLPSTIKGNKRIEKLSKEELESMRVKD